MSIDENSDITAPDDDESGVQGEPYATIPEWILYAEISDRAVRLFVTLSRYVGANDKGWPSRKTLAKKLKCSVASIDRATAELVEIKAVTIQQRRRDNGSLTSSYYWLWPKTPPTERQERSEVPPVVSGGVPSPVTHQEGTTVRSNNTESILFNENNSRSQKAFTPEFEKLWAIYPRRLGKRDAAKAIGARLKARVTLAELLEASENYAVLRAGQDQDYTMLAKTFYGPNERWKDYLNGAPGAKATPKSKDRRDAEIQDTIDYFRNFLFGREFERPVVNDIAERMLERISIREMGRMSEDAFRALVWAFVAEGGS